MANPMYRQIAEDLRQQIESRILEPGAQLPTELELRERYSASRNTVRDAIKWLMSLGLVETRPGQGTFVVEPSDPLLTTLTESATTGFGGGDAATYRSKAKTRKVERGPVRVEIQGASPEVADRLMIKEGAEVISRHERRRIDGRAWSLQTSFYPSEFADRGATRLRSAADIAEGTVQYLNTKLGLKQVGYSDLITSRSPNAAEVEFFRIPPDGRVTVFEVFRTAYDGNGMPMRLTITVYPADRNQFIINVGTVPNDKVPEGNPEI